MKRKLTFGTILLTAFLLCGCTAGDTQGGEAGTGTTSTDTAGTSTNTDGTQSSEQMQENTSSQGSEQVQENNQTTTTEQNSNSESAQNNTVQSGDAQGTMMTEEEAKKLALSYIEITEEDVTFIKCDLENDDGKAYYDVEFYTLDQNDYDFEIDPYTGEIIEWDVEPIYDVNS